MAVLLVGLGVMAVLLTAALPVWRQISQREREEELIFRGNQYARAIGLYQRKFANTSPPSLDVLIEGRFLRAKYKDPMVADGEFQLLYQSTQLAGSGGGQGPGGAAGSRGGQGPGGAAGSAAGTQAGGAIGRGGIIGVVSKSTQTALRLYNGAGRYSEWQFVYVARTQQPGASRGSGTPVSAGSAGARGGRSAGADRGTGSGQMPAMRRTPSGGETPQGGTASPGGPPPSPSPSRPGAF
jgi:type II secretory pathway pseudopilin PulG